MSTYVKKKNFHILQILYIYVVINQDFALILPENSQVQKSALGNNNPT